MIGEKFRPGAAYRSLKIIFYALNTGLLLFLMVGIYLNGMQIPELRYEIDLLTYVNVFLLAAIPVGYSMSSKRMDSIDVGDSFSKKFEQFQLAMILRWGMIEGVAIFSMICFIVEQDSKHLVLFLICILVLSSNNITREKVTRMAKLNAEESKALEE